MKQFLSSKWSLLTPDLPHEGGTPFILSFQQQEARSFLVLAAYSQQMSGVWLYCSGRASALSGRLAPSGLEYLVIEQIASGLAVEALIVTVLPWRTRLDVECLYADPPKPVAHGVCGNPAPLSLRM